MRRLSAARSRHHGRGFSLIEVMIGLAIAALLMYGAGPFYGDFMANARLREGGNLLLAEALAAQSEAVKRNGVVRLSTNGSTIELFDRGAPGDPVLLRRVALSEGVVAATTNIDFGSEGRPVPFGTSGAINLWISGQACSANLRCPGLRVDAGGASRLCANQQVACPS